MSYGLFVSPPSPTHWCIHLSRPTPSVHCVSRIILPLKANKDSLQSQKTEFERQITHKAFFITVITKIRHAQFKPLHGLSEWDEWGRRAVVHSEDFWTKGINVMLLAAFLFLEKHCMDIPHRLGYLNFSIPYYHEATESGKYWHSYNQQEKTYVRYILTVYSFSQTIYWTTGVRFPAGARLFLLATASRPKHTEREADRSPPPNA